MSLTLKAAIAVLALSAAPSLAVAQSVSVSISTADLASHAGRQAIAAKIDAAALRYCRGNPGAGETVDSCRKVTVDELARAVDARAQQLARVPVVTRLADR